MQRDKQNLHMCMLEKCLIGELGGESTSDIPHYIAFRNPLGIPLSQLCINNICREKIVFIAKVSYQFLFILGIGYGS
jgi:hypothetical protein